ncbi:non-ribosomal peptide synthetase [Leeia aquatica]|uniref:AMP-binding protein n=1 Tax=Leeia aquatica TaxID=2725557 RepID=A0A847RXN7_9NEIS|nr:condensation domain-containing protein [Leeia aquatica]NLR75920.1 AMP-binding protein [Leeia aquatica]
MTAMPSRLDAIVPATPLQQGMLYHALLDDDPRLYLEQYGFTVSGTFDLSRYRQAWETSLQQQAMLRASFHWEGLGKAYQVTQQAVSLPWHEHDLRGLSHEAQLAAIEAQRQQRREQGFVLSKAPLFVLDILQLDTQRWKVLLTLHHILLDGWSLSLLLEEVSQRYVNPTASLPPTAPFEHYRAWLAQQDPSSAAAWWQQQLADLGAATPAPLLDTAPGEGSVAFDLDWSAADSARFRQLCQQQGLTGNTVFSAAWALLLARYHHQQEVSFGSTIATRPPEIPGIDRTLGLLLNVLPCRVDCDGEQASGLWLQQLQARWLTAQQHGYLPLSELQRQAGCPGQALFETLLVWENQPGSQADTPAGAPLQVRHDESYEHNPYPLMLAGYPGERIRLRLTVRQGSLDAQGAQQLLAQQQALMLALLTQHEAPLHQVTGLRQRIETTAPTDAPRTPSLWSRWQALCDLAPDALALHDLNAARSYTRQDLMAHTRQWVQQLRTAIADTEPTAPLALLLWPGIEQCTAMLAALYLGRPWLSLDPRRPQDGLLAQLQQLHPTALLTTPDLWPATGQWNVARTLYHAELPQPAQALPPHTPPAADAAALMVLTSGSTGAAKCVELPMQALQSRLDWMAHAHPAALDERMLWKTSPVFVDAVCEVLGPLLSGYPAVSLPDSQLAHPESLVSALTRARITRLVITPSVLEHLLAHLPQPYPGLRLLQVSGERFPVTLLQQARMAFPQARILNVYGSSEVMADATVFDATHWHAPDESVSCVPIGVCLPYLQATLLDIHDQPCLPGAVGQLHISGLGLAKGYRHDEALTRQVFRSLPGQTGRHYATGDLAREHAQAGLLISGRADRQLKLHGVRIEPGEIEHALLQMAGVQAAVVTLHQDPQGQARLSAHLVWHEGHTPHNAASLRSALSGRLPPALIPTHFQNETRLPRTASGKLDRLALQARFTQEDVTALPETEDQHALYGLWQKVIGQAPAGIDQDFFAAGGNSIHMTQLAFAIRKQFAQAFPIRAIFEAPTIRQQADLLLKLRQGEQPHEDRSHSDSQGFDLAQEARAADDILPGAPLQSVWPAGQGKVFLSGAQGFINAWLLARLLDEPDLQVYCLAPGANQVEAYHHLADHLGRFGLWNATRAARLTAVAGQLEAPRFGLEPALWQQLAQEMDVLFHTGVIINFVAPYTQLRHSNALAAAEMLQLASTQRSKPLHFIGSLGVFDHSQATPDSPPVHEDDALQHWQGLPNGYLQARWVSDTLIRRAIRRGLPCSVIRLTTVCGDRTHHQPHPDDMAWQLLRLGMTVKAVPDSARLLDMVPVDEAVNAVVALAKDGQTLGQAWHISNPRRWRWAEVGQALARHGYHLPLMHGKDWSRHVQQCAAELASQTDWQAILPLIGDSWRDHARFLQLDNQKSLNRLTALGQPLTVMDWAHFWPSIHTLIQQGFLPKADQQPV